jgi:uncharacterized membrane protein
MKENIDGASPSGEAEAPEESSRAGREKEAGREALVRQAELIISHVLRGGVLLSATIILAGVVLFYARTLAAGGRSTDVSAFPHTLPSVGQGLAHADPLAMIVLGLLVLLATPVVRVAVSIVAFLLERDWRYVVITSLVLLILLLSFVLGKGRVLSHCSGAQEECYKQ